MKNALLAAVVAGFLLSPSRAFADVNDPAGRDRAFAVCISFPIPGLGTVYRGHTARGVAEAILHYGMVGIAIHGATRRNSSEISLGALGAATMMVIAAADAGSINDSPSTTPVPLPAFRNDVWVPLPPAAAPSSTPTSPMPSTGAASIGGVSVRVGGVYAFHKTNGHVAVGRVLRIAADVITIHNDVAGDVDVSVSDVGYVSAPEP